MANIEIVKSPVGKPLNSVTAPTEDTLTVARGPLTSNLVKFIGCRERPWGVLIGINDKTGSLRTRQAYEFGIAILNCARDCSELEAVIVGVNGERHCLSPDQARKFSKGLLVRSDKADDLQLTHNLRILR